MSSQTNGTSPRDPGAFCSEPAALWGGIAATVLIGLPLIGTAVGYIWTTGWQLVGLIVALYPALMMTQFWASKSYLNGMTWKEIGYTIVWPADLIRSVRFGMRAARGKVTGMEIRQYDDNGHKVMSEPVAFIVGVLVSMFAIVSLLVALKSALSLAWSLVALAVVLWVLASIVYYWVSQVYKGGLTHDEAVKTLLGPIGVISLIREGVKKHEAHQRTTQM